MKGSISQQAFLTGIPKTSLIRRLGMMPEKLALNPLIKTHDFNGKGVPMWAEILLFMRTTRQLENASAPRLQIALETDDLQAVCHHIRELLKHDFIYCVGVELPRAYLYALTEKGTKAATALSEFYSVDATKAEYPDLIDRQGLSSDSGMLQIAQAMRNSLWLKASDIQDIFSVCQTTASRALRTMYSKGLITKTADDVSYTLTSKGEQFIKKRA